MRQVTHRCPACPLGPTPGCRSCHGTGKVLVWEVTLGDRLGELGSNVAFLAFWALGLVVTLFIAAAYGLAILGALGLV